MERWGGMSIEAFLRLVGSWDLCQVVGAGPLLAPHWDLQHLGLITRQWHQRAQLWLGAGTAAADEGEACSQAS